MPGAPWHENCDPRPVLCRSRGARIQSSTMRPRFPRSTVLALAALVLAPVVSTLSAASAPSEVRVVRVWPEYRAESSFVRIAEYFGGREKAPELIVRSQADSRDGYYFLARFESALPVRDAILALEYIVPGDEFARVNFFSVDLPAGSRAVLAGLTGGDWPGAKIAPTAWRLRLLGPGGHELAREQSFLWSMPPVASTGASAPTR